MGSILVADGGGTTVKWALCKEPFSIEYFNTDGFNPCLVDDTDVLSYLSKSLLNIDRNLEKVRYYGAGCTPAKSVVVTEALRSATGCEDVEVASDLLGAARALCGCNEGIVCILGTGSNSCLYNGHDIVERCPSLGYVLGDEGSGAALGRRLISDILKRQMPHRAIKCFQAEIGLTQDEIIERVYRNPAPNAFLASMAPFIKAHLEVEEINNMVVDEMRRFVGRNLSGYTGFGKTPIYFTGSIACNFLTQLKIALGNLPLGGVEPNPLDGIIRYHLER